MAEKNQKVKKRKGTSFGYEDRNKGQILTKTCNIFELVKKTKIQLELKSYTLQNQADVYDGYDDGQHYITVGKSNEESTKTSLERALAHVAFDTSKRQFLDKKAELSMFAQPKHKSIVDDLNNSVYAALESHRVNTCMGQIFKGFDERYKEADKVIGKRLYTDNENFEIDNPITALQCAQLGLEDLVNKSEFPEANKFMKNVERTSGAGSLLLTEQFIDEVLRPWYMKNYGNEPENPQGGSEGEGEGEGDSEGDSEGTNENTGEDSDSGEGSDSDDPADSTDWDTPHKDAKDWKGKKPTDRQTDYLEKLGYDGKIPDTRGGTSDLISDLTNDEGITNPDPVRDQNVEEDDTDRFDPDNDPKDKEINKICYESRNNRNATNCGEKMTGLKNPDFTAETLEDAQEEGEKEIENVENRMAEIGSGSNDDDFTPRKLTWKKSELAEISKSVKEISNLPVLAQPEVDQMVVNRLKQVFKRIKSKPKSEVNDSGNEIDVELFIKDEVEGATDFMTEDVEQQGFAVIIGIDESGSMSGHPIQMARNICGTLYKAFENMPNVKIHVIGWQSVQGRQCQIHKIKKYSEVGTLHTGGGTPFQAATLYLTEYVRKLPQKKKLFFQITDGGIGYDEQTRNHINDMKKQTGTVVTGIHIGYYGGGDPAMEDLFGKENYLKFNTMDEIKPVLINDIAKRFLRYMKC